MPVAETTRHYWGDKSNLELSNNISDETMLSDRINRTHGDFMTWKECLGVVQ